MAKGKKTINAYVPVKLKEHIVEYAEKHGYSVSAATYRLVYLGMLALQYLEASEVGFDPVALDKYIGDRAAIGQMADINHYFHLLKEKEEWDILFWKEQEELDILNAND